MSYYKPSPLASGKTIIEHLRSIRKLRQESKDNYGPKKVQANAESQGLINIETRKCRETSLACADMKEKPLR